MKSRIKVGVCYTVVDWIIGMLIIVSVYGSYMAKMTGIDGFYIQIVLIMCLMMLTLRKGWGLNRSLFFPVLLCMIVCILQTLMYIPSLEPIKQLMYVVLFVCIIKLTGKNTWRLIRKTLLAISIVMSIDALVNLPRVISMNYNWYNVRRYTMLDKPFYSLVLTFAVVFMLLDAFNKRMRNKFFWYAVIAVELFVNIAIIQSKSAILCLAGAVGLMIIKFPRQIRRKIMKAIAAGGVVIILVCIVKPDIIPDYIKVLLNRLVGSFADSVHDYAKYARTYDLRSDIYEAGIKVFFENPLFGIGFGNYKAYGMERFNISQTESSILNTFVEGGLLYALSHIAIVLTILFMLLKGKKRGDWRNIRVEALLVVVLYLAFNIQNDYMSTMYWCIMGAIGGMVFRRNTVREIVKS